MEQLCGIRPIHNGVDGVIHYGVAIERTIYILKDRIQVCRAANPQGQGIHPRMQFMLRQIPVWSYVKKKYKLKITFFADTPLFILPPFMTVTDQTVIPVGV